MRSHGSLFPRMIALVAALSLALMCAAGAWAELAADDVVGIEQRLYALGYLSTEPDEDFDEETRQALVSFQQANGLEATGEPDAATLSVLDGEEAVSRQDYLSMFAENYRQMTPLKNGNINSQVQVMQRRLNELGYFNGTSDGVFGDATQTAVERFQMVNGLPVTGIADGATMMRLMADAPITWSGFLSEMSAAAGDAGLNVYVLQKKLAVMGYFTGECSGSFGEQTQKAVAQFQAANELDDTGIADAATWERIYSGSAVARKRADVMQVGDFGDNVAQVQRRLGDLGYFSHEPTGNYDYTTETAMRLFQMANGLPSSGEGDNGTLSQLMSDAAKALGDDGVQTSLDALMAGRSETVQAVIHEIAGQMIGAAFVTQDDELYPGFALVQYVCVAAGLPITDPEALMRLVDDPVEDAEEAVAGNIVALQAASSDSVTMLLTIADGDGRVIYATPEIGWVVVSYIDQLNSGSVYRWAEPSTEAAP